MRSVVPCPGAMIALLRHGTQRLGFLSLLEKPEDCAMSFPVLVEMSDEQFAASLVGAPSIRVVQPTRSQAIAALKVEIQRRVEDGELLSFDVDVIGVSDLAGKYSSDPTLREICDQAYQSRDAELDP